MGDKKKICDNLKFTPIDKEADILDQLQICQIYFQLIANSTSLAENTSHFYDNLRVSICLCNGNCIT
jgi:hypothetical protein